MENKNQEGTDEAFMQLAIREAKASRLLGDYAIGAVIARNRELICKAGNRIRTESDPTSHTEVVALRMACRDLGTRYLEGCTLYSTHAPCPMCLGACVWAKIGRVIYGANQLDILEYGMKNGNAKFKWRAVGIEPEDLYHKYLFIAHPGIEIKQMMREECISLFHS